MTHTFRKNIQSLFILPILLTPIASKAQSASCVQIPSNAVGFWRFDENAIDSVGSNHGTPVGTRWEWRPGYVNEAFWGGGIDASSYINVPYSSDLALDAEITIEMWVEIVDVSGLDKTIVIRSNAEGANASSPYLFGVNGSFTTYLLTPGAQVTGTPGPGRVYFMINDANNSAEQALFSNTALTPGWHHIAVAVNSDHIYMYIDGALVQDASRLRVPWISNTFDMRVGQTGDSNPLTIDELTVYNRALSQSELQSIVEADLSGKCLNNAPTLDPIGNKAVGEGELLQFVVSAQDPDADTLIFEVSNVPAGATFNAETREFSWVPEFYDSGNYEVLFSVNDGRTPPLSDQESVIITVGNVNRLPVLNPIGSKDIEEGALLEFTVSGSDPDGDTLTYQAGNLPTGATFDSETQTFSWNVGYEDAGNYEVIFSVHDGSGQNSETIAITVGDVNRPPVLAEIGSKSVQEGEELMFTVSASDPDGDNLTYEAIRLPDGATFDQTTQVFTWAPSFEQAGNYSDVEFIVSDDGSPLRLDMETITITVGNTNRAPIIDPIGNQNVTAGDLIEFLVAATDLDGDDIVLTASSLPTGAIFDGETGAFNWIPASSQTGDTAIEFTATDDGTPSLSGSLQVVITIDQLLTPVERIELIVEAVENLNLNSQLERKLVKELGKAQKNLGKNKVGKALSDLNDFIAQVQSAEGSVEISSADANNLIDMTTQVINSLS